MRIVFCGNTFPEMPERLAHALRDQHDIIVWDGNSINLPTNVDILIPLAMRIGRAEMEKATPRLIHQFGVGLDNVDITAAEALGIIVANVPGTGGNADSVAEHAILLTLMLLRQSSLAQKNVRAGILGSPTGKALFGKTVCLYGLGAVARSLAPRLAPFGVRLIGLSRSPHSKDASFHLERCYPVENTEACLAQTDILIVCVKHTHENTGLIGEKELRWLKPGAMLINIARAGLIDKEGLSRCVVDGHLSGVGMDVFWKEPASPDDALLWDPNVVVTPHIAGITDRSLSEIAEGVAENIRRLAANEKLQNVASSSMQR